MPASTARISSSPVLTDPTHATAARLLPSNASSSTTKMIPNAYCSPIEMPEGGGGTVTVAALRLATSLNRNERGAARRLAGG